MSRPSSDVQEGNRILGLDGCRAGWLCVFLAPEGGWPQASVVPDFARLLERFPAAKCIAVDIPIGLPDSGARACDVEARERIKPRHSSVFPAPLRAILGARSYEEANLKSKEISRKGLPKQAFAIIPKIAEVDAAMRGDPVLRDIVYEVHPELCFRTWAGEPMQHPKRSEEGEQARMALIEAVWPGALARTSFELRKTSGWEDDDLVDAFAALWTATRIIRGAALQVPSISEFDSAGLPMRMFA